MEELFDKEPTINPTPTFVKKFYFLDYFYILLESVNIYSNQNEILEEFIKLKNKHLLGESKYKKLTIDDDRRTRNQMAKYVYTFQQVLSESIEYGLVSKKNTNKNFEDDKNSAIIITQTGRCALTEYENNGKYDFNLFMLKIMEEKHYSFYQLLKLCYEDNTLKNGLLIFPIYSGIKLGFDKSTFTTNQHVLDYSNALMKKLENDIRKYTRKDIVSLKNEESKLIDKLKVDNDIGDSPSEAFDNRRYNAVLSKFRKHWLNYFLRNIYEYRHNFNVFNIWIERAKQIGILHTTEFFPDFSGRIVYPTSIISSNTSNNDFMKVYTYPSGESLFIHKPQWNEDYKTEFVRTLLDEYYILQKTRNTHFINLLDLRERVCFKLRIPSFVFDEFLEKSYILNLQGKLKIQISLEADKLPHETNAMYLRREPVSVNGKLKNIIAINYK